MAVAAPADAQTVLIREAVATRPSVLVVTGLTNARRAREATKTVPVVVATSSDLVDAGFVSSLALNRKVATAFGIPIPSSVLPRTDRVLE
jgi:ABC-type uncharacterized transport system substrate-binding protein